MEYELEQYTARTGSKVTFNMESRRRFLEFAVSQHAVWKANFRDLNGAITRMATLAPAGRITVDVVEEEINRLEAAWGGTPCDNHHAMLDEVLGQARATELDRFDRLQLADVIRICRQSRTLSEAGRRLFDVSRTPQNIVKRRRPPAEIPESVWHHLGGLQIEV